MKTEWAKQFGAAAIAAFAMAGCSGMMGSADSGMAAGHGHMAMAQSTASDAMTASSATKAADLRAGLNYLLGFGTPNVYFHYTMVYALLRHNGLDLGKPDYVG